MVTHFTIWSKSYIIFCCQESSYSARRRWCYRAYQQSAWSGQRGGRPVHRQYVIFSSLYWIDTGYSCILRFIILLLVDLVRDTAIDLTKRMKAWRESLKKLTFIWYKNKEAHLEILCNALDLQGTACRKPSALEALELRTSIDLINPDNMFDHDTLQWRRLDHLLLGHPESYSSLRSLDLHININRICREIRKEFTSATGRGWIAQYVDDWLEQVPLKNILGPSRVEFRTQVSSFALMFPGRDGEE